MDKKVPVRSPLHKSSTSKPGTSTIYGNLLEIVQVHCVCINMTEHVCSGKLKHSSHWDQQSLPKVGNWVCSRKWLTSVGSKLGPSEWKLWKKVGRDTVRATEAVTEVLLYFYVSLESTWIPDLDFWFFFYMYRKSFVLKS